LLAFFLTPSFIFSQDAPQAGEPGPWYLISETELQSIEASLERLETDRQSWELQARELKNEAKSLNYQLAEERRRYRTLEQSFNEYEAEKSLQLSLKNGEAADLNRRLAEQALKAEKYKGAARNRLILNIALGAAWAVLIAFKALRFFRII
jgi:predicted RNase H-like nuclease (RuvC/YqgF family)